MPAKLRPWSSPQIVFALAALCLIWGLAFVVFHVGLRDVPPLTFTAARAIVSSAFLIGVLVASGRPFPRDRATHVLAAALGLTNVSLFWGFQSLALRRISPGEAAILIYLQPLLVALGAWWLLGERPSSLKVLGFAAGFLGVVLVLGSQVRPSAGGVGYLYAIGAAVGWAAGTIVYKRWGTGQELLWITALQTVYGTIPLAILAGWLEGPRIQITFTGAWTILYAGLGASALAYLLWLSLLRQRPASQVASFVFLVPVVAVVADALLLGDHFGLGFLVGGALVAFGIWLANTTSASQPRLVARRSP